MIYFTAHTFKCVCHCRRAMFRVLGMYNFELLQSLVPKQTCKFNCYRCRSPSNTRACSHKNMLQGQVELRLSLATHSQSVP